MEQKENSLMAIKLNDVVSSVITQTHLQGFERAYATANAIQKLQELLTPEYLKPIMALQGNRLGVKTDKDKSGGYPADVFKNCLIEAVLMGLQPYGNEFNIIAGNTYATKEGVGRLLATWKGLKYSLICGVPKPNPDGKSAVVEVTIKWTINNESKEELIPISIKMDAYTSVDAMIGKATRKGRAWLLSAISGIEIVEADVTDAEFMDVTPKQTHQEVSQNKQYDRVVAHIESETTNTLEELMKCAPAIRDVDHDLIEKYSRKHIELSTTLEQLLSLQFKHLINEESDFDLFVYFSDRKKELTPKK
jgi:hypothetical protein